MKSAELHNWAIENIGSRFDGLSKNHFMSIIESMKKSNLNQEEILVAIKNKLDQNS